MTRRQRRRERSGDEVRGRTRDRWCCDRGEAQLVRLAPRLLRSWCVDAGGFDQHAAGMTVDADAAVPWTRFVRYSRTVIAIMGGSDHGLRAIRLRSMGVAQRGEAEKNERKHADRRHQTTSDGSETDWIYNESRKLGRHVLVLKHLCDCLNTNRPAHH